MTNNAGRCSLKATLLAAVLAALAIGCGNKAPPFLPETVAPRKLEFTRITVGEGTAAFEFRVPREQFSLGKEEDPWTLARILRRDPESDVGAFVERKIVKSGPGYPFGEKVTFVDEGIEEGRTYVYRVELRKRKSRDTAASEPVSFAVRAIPEAPRGVRTEGREGGVTLSWDAPPSSVEGLTYDLFRRGPGERDPRRVNRDPLAGGRYTDTEVSREEEYCYRVRPVLREGVVVTEGDLSPEACAVTDDRTPPPAPSGLLLAYGKKGYTLTWIPVEADDLAGYNVYRSVGGGPFLKMNDTPLRGTRYKDKAVDPGRTYSYRVTTVDNSAAGNESPISEVVKGTFIVE